MIEVRTTGHARNNPRVERFALYLDAFKFVVEVLKTNPNIIVQSVKETLLGCEIKDYLFSGNLGSVVECAKEYIESERVSCCDDGLDDSVIGSLP